MSIRDYDMGYVVVNEITNERIQVPTLKFDTDPVFKKLTIDKSALFDIIMMELEQGERITITKEYMKST